jgi:hypothetical protein
MGCWNKTCALSNLPIFAGEEVYVFLIEQNGLGLGSGNHCYSNHLYSPIITPFYSHYDDYGAGENNSGVALPVIINSLKKVVVEKEVGENKYHDLEVKRDTLSEDNLFELMQEQRLSIKNPYRNLKENNPEEVLIEFVMMKKDIVDDILNKSTMEVYWNKSFVKFQLSDVFCEVDAVIDAVIEANKTRERVIKALDDNKEKLSKENIKSLSDLNLVSHNADMAISAYTMEPLLVQAGLKTSAFAPTLHNSVMNGHSRIVSFWPEFSNMISEGNLDIARSYFIDTFKGIFIHSFFESTRRSWIPQSGEGGQNVDFDEHKLLANSILKSIAKQEKEWEEDE